MKTIITLVLALLLLAGITVTYTVMANPGSDTDPIISFSYLKEIFKPEVKQETEKYRLWHWRRSTPRLLLEEKLAKIFDF